MDENSMDESSMDEERIMSYSLTFSQAQGRAFVIFKELGFDIFCKPPYNKVRLFRWGNACVSVTFILVAINSSYPAEYNFGLTADHVKSLGDMLWVANDFKNEYDNRKDDTYTAEATLLYEKFFAAFSVCKESLEKAINSGSFI